MLIRLVLGGKLVAQPFELNLVMLKTFYRYFTVGILNTALHWGVFAIATKLLMLSQAVSNFSGFIVAVTFSFFVNARFTFNKSPTSRRYFIFIAFMGLLSIVTGYVADYADIPGIYTLIFFSGTSLVLGFFYSKFVVFN